MYTTTYTVSDVVNVIMSVSGVAIRWARGWNIALKKNLRHPDFDLLVT